MATRHIFSYSFFHEGLTPLRDLGAQVVKHSSIRFTQDYGNNVSLLNALSEPWALPTLLQYFNPKLCCFTFHDYQLLPTLEEYVFILNVKVQIWVPFVNVPEVFNLEVITEDFYLSLNDVKGNWKHKSGVFGFPSRFITMKSKEVVSETNWLAFNVVVAILIYGIVMFPNVMNFVDCTTVYLFMDKNLVPTLFADTYHSIHSKNGMKGTIVCFLPLLNKWFMSHLPVGGPSVDVRGTYSFSQRFMSLTHHDIKWPNPEMNISETVMSFGEFSNNPLIKRKGCINYNPKFALRRLGYAMDGESFDKDVVDSVFFDKVKKVQLAWVETHWKDEAFLGRKDASSGIPYTRWVIKRVETLLFLYSPRRIIPLTDSMK